VLWCKNKQLHTRLSLWSTHRSSWQLLPIFATESCATHSAAVSPIFPSVLRAALPCSWCWSWIIIWINPATCFPPPACPQNPSACALERAASGAGAEVGSMGQSMWVESPAHLSLCVLMASKSCAAWLQPHTAQPSTPAPAVIRRCSLDLRCLLQKQYLEVFNGRAQARATASAWTVNNYNHWTMLLSIISIHAIMLEQARSKDSHSARLVVGCEDSHSARLVVGCEVEKVGRDCWPWKEESSEACSSARQAYEATAVCTGSKSCEGPTGTVQRRGWKQPIRSSSRSPSARLGVGWLERRNACNRPADAARQLQVLGHWVATGGDGADVAWTLRNERGRALGTGRCSKRAPAAGPNCKCCSYCCCCCCCCCCCN